MNPTMTAPAAETTPRTSERGRASVTAPPTGGGRARQWTFAFDGWRGAERKAEFVLF